MALVDQVRMMNRRVSVGACCEACEKEEADGTTVVVRGTRLTNPGYAARSFQRRVGNPVAVEKCVGNWCEVGIVARTSAAQRRGGLTYGAGLAAGVATQASGGNRRAPIRQITALITPTQNTGGDVINAIDWASSSRPSMAAIAIPNYATTVRANPMAFVSPIQPQGFGFGDEFWVHSMSASDWPFWAELKDLAGNYSSWGSTMDVKFRCNSYLGCDELDADVNDINYEPLTIKRNGLKNGTWYTCTWNVDGANELVSCVVAGGGGGGIDHSGLQDSFYQEPIDASFMPGLGFPATRRRNSRGSAGSFSGGGFRQGGM